MKLYRLTETRFASDLTGTGGLYGPGRWHNEGTRLLYTAQHVSLAIVEVLANTEILPRDYSLVTFELPVTASIRQLTGDELPANRRDVPAPAALADFATIWIQQNQHWVLRVPSVQSPTEYNYLLNPLHPEHQTLKVVSIEPHPFHARLR